MKLILISTIYFSTAYEPQTGQFEVEKDVLRKLLGTKIGNLLVDYNVVTGGLNGYESEKADRNECYEVNGFWGTQ